MSSHSSNSTKRIRLAMHRLVAPIVLIGLSYALLNWIPENIADPEKILSHIAESILWLSFTFLLIRVIDITFWRYLLPKRGRHVPLLLREVFATLVLLATASLIISQIFGQSLTILMAASTMLVGVVGLALKHPILDVFSGIVLTLQRPFDIGDWIEINGTQEIGRVTEINWRDVHLVTPDDVTYLVPNSEFISHRSKVYSRPDHFFRDEIRVTLPYRVTTHQGQRILLGAVNQVEEIAALPRTSIVSIANYTDSGVEWRLLYWCPDPGRIPVFRFKVHQNILRNLHYANIEIPFPVRELRRYGHITNPSDDTEGIDPLIQRVPIFASLTSEELRLLSRQAQTLLARAGEPLIRQGNAGDSLFILREGILEVRKTLEDQSEVVVDHIKPGHFFGEMSLLLGEPRSATIVPKGDAMVIKITKQPMQQLMQARPELAQYLAEVLAERRSQSAAKLAHYQSADEAHTLFEHLAQGIRAFFSLH